MAGDSSYNSVVLLLHNDDAAFPDTSSYAHVGTAPSVTFDAAVKQFGAGSAKFSFGASARIFPDAPEFDLSTGDWTIEASARFDSGFLGAAESPIIHKQDSGHTPFKLSLNTTGNLIALCTDDSGAPLANIDGGVIAFDTFVPISLVRHGSTFTLRVSGITVGTATSAAALNVNSQPVQVGGRTASSAPFHGWVDEVRVTKGVARYLTDYTPASGAFDDFYTPDVSFMAAHTDPNGVWFPLELALAMHSIRTIPGYNKAQLRTEAYAAAAAGQTWIRRDPSTKQYYMRRPRNG